MRKVVVIGGGISGLACARRIADEDTGAQITLLEASSRVGGNIKTEDSSGFVCEMGPSGFLNRHPSTLALAERVGLGDAIITGCEQVRRRYIYSDGKLRRFPDSPQTFLTTDLLSVKTRARVLLEPAIPPSENIDDETVGSFAARRLGKEAADLLIDPVISGIYAGDPNRLSLRAAVPELASMDGNGKSLLTGLLQARRRSPDTPSAAPSTIGRRRYVSFSGGLGQLTNALRDSLSGVIRYDSPAIAVERDGAKWRLLVGGDNPTEIIADAVVSAAPAPAVRKYLSGLHDDIDTACARTPYAPVAMVALGFREADIPHPLAGFGYLVPSREGGSVLGGLWSTSIFPGQRGGPGKVLLQAVLGGAREPEICQLDDDVLIRRARTQFKRALGISASPIHARVYRHHLGMPQYEVGHTRRVSRAEAALLNFPGLFLTGNAFRGVGINACTADADRTADAVATYVRALATQQYSSTQISPLP